MRKIFFVLTVLCPFVSVAQQSVHGIVTDIETSQPVEGATITTNNNSVAAISDKNGKFQLQFSPNADSIFISSVGYNKMSLHLKSNARSLNVALQPNNTSLSEVAIQGVRPSGSATTLTKADLDRTSGLNLQDALNVVPGVQMDARTPWGGQHIIIRGYYPSSDNGRSNGENFAGLGYQLYINGIPVTDATGTTIMDDIDFSTLGKVEIVKGPSPLYGSYTAGAVSLYTARPAPGQTSVQEQIIGGSYGLFRDNTTIQTATAKSDIWINYGHQTYNGFRPNDASQKDYASFAANFTVSDKQTVSTYFSYSHSYEQLAGEIDSADFYSRNAVSNPAYVNNNSHMTYESYRAGITDKYIFNAHFSNQTALFASGLSLDEAYAHGFDNDQNINFGGRTAFNYNGSAGTVNIAGTLGAVFQRSNQLAEGNFFLPFIMAPFTAASAHNIPSDNRNYAMNYDAFTQWRFSLPTQWSLTVGASINYAEFGTQNLLANNTILLNNPTYIHAFTPVFTPSAMLTKVIGNSCSVYASFAMGYTPPALSQVFNTAGVLSPGLQPERSAQYEIGTKGDLVNNKLHYQVAAFDMDITDRLVAETINTVAAYTNAGEQTNLGLEVYGAYDIINNKTSFFSLLRPWISYTYSQFTYGNFKNMGKGSTGQDSVLSDFSNKKVAGIAPNVVNAGIDLATKIGLGLSVEYRYVDKTPVTFDNATTMKAYSLLSARIDYKRQFGKHIGLDVFAGADNLLNSTYYNFIFVGQNIQELAQGTDPYVKNGGGDGYILPAPYKATFYSGFTIKYIF